MTLPRPDQLQRAWEELQEIHREHLAVHGVSIPKVEHYANHKKAIWLAALWHFNDRHVHKDEISAIVQRDAKGAGADQQVRHLKRDGWEIGTTPGKHKLDPYRPSQEFLNASARRRALLGAKSFQDVKTAFGSRCATCGASEGKPDPRYGSDKVQLQKGHRNPKESGDEAKNIIPQCQFCNRSYQNDFEFDEKGRVHAVASVEPVKRADISVQLEILEWLTEKHCD